MSLDLPSAGECVPGEITPPAPALARLRRWRRRLWLVVGLATIVLAVGWTARVVHGGGVGGSDTQNFDGGSASGPAPQFSLPDLVDPATTVSLDQFRGRPLVINFWASWCVPCRREMPRLAAAQRRLGDRVGFVGIDYQDGNGDGLALARETGVTYPSGVNSDGAVGERYGLYGLPTTVFVAPDGRIVGRHLGELSTATLTRLLDRLVTAQ